MEEAVLPGGVLTHPITHPITHPYQKQGIMFYGENIAKDFPIGQCFIYFLITVV